jgi:hypothetical protein
METTVVAIKVTRQRYERLRKSLQNAVTSAEDGLAREERKLQELKALLTDTARLEELAYEPAYLDLDIAQQSAAVERQKGAFAFTKLELAMLGSAPTWATMTIEL